MGLTKECRQEVLKKMAETFGAQLPTRTLGNWGDDVAFDEEGAAGLLGIEPEEVETLCRVGVIPSSWTPADGTNITGETMLVFLEENAEWWFRLRLRKEIASLKEQLARATARRTGADKLHAKLVRKALLATARSMKARRAA